MTAMARAPFDPATDYYALLGVGQNALPEEIQAAYRRLAKAYHPDLNAGSENAAAQMARLNVAKAVLLDNDTRASYDQARRGVPTRRQAVAAAAAPPADYVGVPYAPYQPGRPRHRIVPNTSLRSAPPAGFDRGTGVFLLVVVPLIALLVIYVFQAVQTSIQPLKEASADINLVPGSNTRPTARGAADAVYQMVHTQPPSRDLALRANNFILARSDSSPESELLRADGRRLIRAASSDDPSGWDDAVTDICQLAARC